MSKIRTLARSFAGGEVTPEFWGRIDDAKYQTGLALCRNFVPLPHGPAVNRPGTAFVHETKFSNKRAVLRPFAYSTTQTMALEFGDMYVRFHTQGATLLQGTPAAYNAATAYTPGDLVAFGGSNYVNILASTGVSPPTAANWYLQPTTGEYEIPSPFALDDVADLHFVQSADVLSIVHPDYQPRELRRGGALKWYFTAVVTVSALVPPTGVVGTPTSATAGAFVNKSYTVTTLGEGADESLPSSIVTVLNNLNGLGNFNTITWSAAVGASRYNVYKLEGGIYGFIGQAAGLSFVDDNIAPDTSYCPPENVNPFSGANEYPRAITYHEQRRCFAGSTNKPQNFWATRSGSESNLQYAIPTRDDDSIQFRIASKANQTIRHMVSLQDLLLLTTAGVWRVTGSPFTPTNFALKRQSSVGANNVQPLETDSSILYVANRGSHPRELSFNNDAGGFVTNDLGLRAPHLFDSLDVVDAAYAEAPYSVGWFVSSNGLLLSLTYVPAQSVYAWARHDTDGLYESCCVVAEGNEDVLYVIVKRTINSAEKRFVERLASRAFATKADAFFVDCGLTYNGAPATVISGLTWLEGETVNILADGAVHPQRVVTGGAVTLDTAASKVQVGLPITADLQTLPLAFEAQGYGAGRQKNINFAWLRVNQSSGIFAGPSFDKLKEAAVRTIEPYGSSPALKTGEVQIVLTPTWAAEGQVCVRQTDPLPLTVVNISLEVEVG